MQIWSLMPESWKSFIEDGSNPLALLFAFVGIPLAFGVAAGLGLATWIVLSKFIAAREEVEAMLRSGIFGGHLARD